MTTTTTTAGETMAAEPGLFVLSSGACRGKTISAAMEAKGRGYLVKLRNATKGDQPGKREQRTALELFLTERTDKPARQRGRAAKVDVVALAKSKVKAEAAAGGAAPIKAPGKVQTPKAKRAERPDSTTPLEHVRQDRGQAAPEAEEPTTPEPAPGRPVVLEVWGDYTVVWPDGNPRGSNKRGGLRVFDDDPALTWPMPGGAIHSERFKLRPSQDQSSAATPVRSAFGVRYLRGKGYDRLAAEVAKGELVPIVTPRSRRANSTLTQERPTASHQADDLTTPPLLDPEAGAGEGDDPTTLGTPGADPQE